MKGPHDPSLPAIALGHAWEWSRAAGLQLERFRKSGTVSDAYLLVIAVRNVLRAGRLARDELHTDSARAVLDQALAEFEAALPGAKNARDVLEHFDDYARGRGGRGRGAGFGPYRIRLSGSEERNESGWPMRIVLHVGPHPVDLTAAPHAAAALVHKMYQALQAEDPSGPY